MDKAFVEDAEDDVYGREGSSDQPQLVGKGILESLRGALESCMDTGWHSQLCLRFFKSGDCLSERNVRCEVECERNRGVLSLVIDGESSTPLLPVGDGGERHHRAGGCRSRGS